MARGRTDEYRKYRGEGERNSDPVQCDVITFEWENLILVPAFRMQIWHLQFYEYICAAKLLQWVSRTITTQWEQKWIYVLSHISNILVPIHNKCSAMTILHFPLRFPHICFQTSPASIWVITPEIRFTIVISDRLNLIWSRWREMGFWYSWRGLILNS